METLYDLVAVLAIVGYTHFQLAPGKTRRHMLWFNLRVCVMYLVLYDFFDIGRTVIYLSWIFFMYCARQTLKSDSVFTKELEASYDDMAAYINSCLS
ncbi:Hypothetical protein POVN_LOCUS700 [uncultured virus]|nr:Hypothetical protein POVN_LOCUS700 [uncultured virus]